MAITNSAGSPFQREMSISPSSFPGSSPKNMATSPAPSPINYRPTSPLHQPDQFCEYQTQMKKRMPPNSDAQVTACSVDLALGYKAFASVSGVHVNVKPKIVDASFYETFVGKVVLEDIKGLVEFVRTHPLFESFKSSIPDTQEQVAQLIGEETSFGEACAVLISKACSQDDMEAVEAVDKNHVFLFQALYFIANTYRTTLKQELDRVYTERIYDATRELEENASTLAAEIDKLRDEKEKLSQQAAAEKQAEDEQELICFATLVSEETRREQIQSLTATIREKQKEFSSVKLKIAHMIKAMRSEMGEGNTDARRKFDDAYKFIVETLQRYIFIQHPYSCQGKYVGLNFKKHHIHSAIESFKLKAHQLCIVDRRDTNCTFALFTKAPPYQIYDSTVGMATFGENHDQAMHYLESRLGEMADSKEDPIQSVTQEVFVVQSN